MPGNVTLRFQIPLSAKVVLPIEDALRRQIEALNFHPGEKARIRAADRLLRDEPNGEAELEVRSAMAGKDLTIASTWVEVMDDNTYRVRHGIEGHEGMVSGAALDEAGNVEIGYGAVFERDGQTWACLFDDCHPTEVPAGSITFLREPLPVSGFERAFLYQNDAPDHPGSFVEELKKSPVTGEFHLRNEDGACSVIAAPWLSGLGENELEAINLAFARRQAPRPSDESPTP